MRLVQTVVRMTKKENGMALVTYKTHLEDFVDAYAPKSPTSVSFSQIFLFWLLPARCMVNGISEKDNLIPYHWYLVILFYTSLVLCHLSKLFYSVQSGYRYRDRHFL
jgi:hypothetical protein